MSQIERLFFIHSLLAVNYRPTPRQLMAWCECSDDTIRRDLAFLRTNLAAPIVLRGGAYQYDRPFSLVEAARMVPCPPFP